MTQTVYISEYLKDDVSNKVKYGEHVYQQLNNIDEIEIKKIEKHSKNVWCRDYMPIKGATGELVHFDYSPPYMMDTDKWKARRPKREDLRNDLKVPSIDSDIILDGGAIEIHGTSAIVSDRVFRDNKLPEEEVIEKIKKALKLERLIVVPQHPFDFTGHVDGMVRFIDSETVFISEMLADGKVKELEVETNSYRRQLIDNWYYAFKYSLINAGFKLEKLPCTAHLNKNDKSGHGIYLNFLKLDGLILMPSYKQDEDFVAQKQLETLYGAKVIMIDATELSEEGGMINCVTWTK
ncbi:agmatine deiminase family protein [uncultured Draconibacterium sp.]|uniref:agmatine deiminase family protein n=1 Tax=uncultured Draconibacterium sp. TaxID=1573823 RepID=UPI003216D044